MPSLPSKPPPPAARRAAHQSQLPEQAVLPAYRGRPLQAFLAACDGCAEVGHSKDHLPPAAARCLVCAQNRKSVSGAPAMLWGV